MTVSRFGASAPVSRIPAGSLKRVAQARGIVAPPHPATSAPAPSALRRVAQARGFATPTPPAPPPPNLRGVAIARGIIAPPPAPPQYADQPQQPQYDPTGQTPYYQDAPMQPEGAPQEQEQLSPSQQAELNAFIAQQEAMAQGTLAQTGEQLNPQAQIAPQYQGISDFNGESLQGATAYMHRGQLCTLGVCDTPYGTVPVSHAVYVSQQIEDGPLGSIHVGDDVRPLLEQALQHSSGMLNAQSTDHELEMACEALVLRARAEDQNAQATIAECRNQAMAGNEAAARSFACVQRYIAAHPQSEFGAEVDAGGTGFLKGSAMRAAVRLADGPQLTRARVRDMGGMFGAEGDDRRLFMFAVANYRAPQLKEIAQRLGEFASKIISLGKGVGTARALQMIRDPRVPISVVSPKVGWELGEALPGDPG